ncbi:MAG: hypothetical protein ABEL04_09260 [Salinibacter sp.]|uniref:hypothetical protein n=1 Tax=Salinibacter sp. TaxID=2065818 RepID=UPI0035D45687
MFEVSRRYRQYLGLVFLIVVFVGGMIGWTCATLQVKSSGPAPADTTGSVQVNTVVLRASVPPVDRSPNPSCTADDGSAQVLRSPLLQKAVLSLTSGTARPPSRSRLIVLNRARG